MALPNVDIDSSMQQAGGSVMDGMAGSSLSQIDEKVQSAKAVQRSWGLPALPETVTFDLAATPELATGAEVAEFMQGLRQDVTQATRPRVVQQSAQLPPELEQAKDESPLLWDIRKAYNGVAGLRAPKVVDDSAAGKLKQRMIDRGLLPPDTPIDSSWDPGLNSAYRDLLQADTESRMGGNRPGSLSFTRGMEILEDWFSPSGLISAGVALDFLPDFNQIGKEFSGWGDKFRGWLKNPLDPKKFIDAMTGPLDDILVPVVNTALLFTGVGNVYHTARAASMGAKAAKAWSGIRFSGRFAGMAPGAQILDDIARFQKPGLILGRSAKATAALQPWRSHVATITAKKAIQQGMRLGAVGKAESVLFPGFQGTGSFSDLLGAGDALTQAERIDEYKRYRTSNAGLYLASSAFEVPLSPTNIFAAGRVGQGMKAFKETTNWWQLDKATRTNLLRSGQVDSRRLSDELFGHINRNGKTTSTFAQAHIAHLRSKLELGSLGSDEAQHVEKLVGEMDRYVREGRHGDALKLAYGTDDDATAGALSSFIATSAAIDFDSRVATNLRLGRPVAEAEEPLEFGRTYHTIRDQHIDQLRRRAIPETEEDWLDTVFDVARSQSAGYRDFRRQFKRNSDRLHAEIFSDDPAVRATARENVLSELEHHNGLAEGHWNKLLDSVDDEVLAEYYTKTIDRIGNWDDFVYASSRLEDLTVRGDLNEAAFVQFDTAYDDIRGFADELTGSLTKVPNRSSWASRVKKLHPDPMKGRFTVARADTPTYQDAVSVMHHVKQLQSRLKNLSILEENPSIVQKVVAPLVDAAATQGKRVSRLQEGEVKALVAELGGSDLRPGQVNNLTKQLRELDRQGYDVTRAVDQIRADIKAIEDSPMWEEAFGIPSWRPLQGSDKTKGKLQLLQEKSNILAREVDVPAHLADEFSRAGYKVVYGVDFLDPSDVAELPGIFGDIPHRMRRRQNFVSFFTRNGHYEAQVLRERKFRNELARASQADGVFGLSKFGDPHAPEVDDVLRALQTYHRNLQSGLEAGIDDAATLWERTTARARMQGSPFSIYDLRPAHVEKALHQAALPSDEATVRAVTSSLKRSIDTGFETRGLNAIEDYLRSHSATLEGLRWLGRTGVAAAIRAEATPGKKLTTAIKGGFSGIAKRGITSVTGGAIGATLGAQAGLEPGDDTLLGGALPGALAGAFLGPKGARAAAGFLTKEHKYIPGLKSGWSDYGRLPDWLTAQRDRLRFGLSPFFDLSRYTEGMMLGQIAVPDDVMMPVNYSSKKAATWLKKKGLADEQAIKAFRQEFTEVAGVDFDNDALEATVRFFRNEGIMGFNPTDWMSGAFISMRAQGVAPAEAYEAAKTLFTYGTKGRSAAELSVNFIFFPFSFQKKLAGHMAQFLSTDLGRAVAIQDSYKAYEFLNERYDLNQRWEDHLPILGQLRRLNTFAMGWNPGQLGGVNRMFIDAANELPLIGDTMTAAWDASMLPSFFSPHGVFVKDEQDAINLQRLMRRAIPLWNDAERLIDDAFEQGEVFTGGVSRGEWLSAQAEIEQGYDKWSDVRSQFEAVAQENGQTLAQFLRGEDAANVKVLYEQERAKIERDLPAFGRARQRSAANAVARDTELAQLASQIQLELDEDPTGSTLTESELGLREFMLFENEIKAVLGGVVNVDTSPELVPAEYFQLVQSRAADLIRRYPMFARLWRRHYEPTYGPVTLELT